MGQGTDELVEKLLGGTYWVVDILPYQVPKEKGGQYFAVERHFLSVGYTDLKRKWAEMILRLYCYCDLIVNEPGSEEFMENPVPKRLQAWIESGKTDLNILIDKHESLIVLPKDALTMTIYNPSETIKSLLNKLAASAGLFLWQPPLNGQSQIQRVERQNRESVNSFILESWNAYQMAVRGEIIDLREADGFCIENDDRIAALVTFRVHGDDLEILSLDSRNPHMGHGSALINRVKDEAKRLGCSRITLITTNDNLNALRFYQKRGFTLSGLFPGAVMEARKRKPEIPLVGDDGILIRDELELEMILSE